MPIGARSFALDTARREIVRKFIRKFVKLAKRKRKRSIGKRRSANAPISLYVKTSRQRPCSWVVDVAVDDIDAIDDIDRSVYRGSATFTLDSRDQHLSYDARGGTVALSPCHESFDPNENKITDDRGRIQKPLFIATLA